MDMVSGKLGVKGFVGRWSGGVNQVLGPPPALVVVEPGRTAIASPVQSLLFSGSLC